MLDLKGSKITYFGHSAFGFTAPSGQFALVDPWLTNPLCPESARKLARLDSIFLSHAHADHLGETLALATQFQPRILSTFETYLWLESKKTGATCLPGNKGGSQQVGDFHVTMTDAFHSNSIEDGDKVIYAGEACSFILTLPGGLTIYHAGDTCLFGDMKLIGEHYKPQIACVPIGDVFTMGPRDAAQAVRLLGVKHVIPMHYATFPLLTGTPEAFRADLKDVSGLEIYALKPGESLG